MLRLIVLQRVLIARATGFIGRLLAMALRACVTGTEALLTEAGAAGVRRVVFVSSVKAAGESTRGCVDEAQVLPPDDRLWKSETSGRRGSAEHRPTQPYARMREISRVAALLDPENDVGQSRASEEGVRSLGLRLHVLKVRRPDSFEAASAEAQRNRAGGAQRNRAGGLVVLALPFFYAHRTASGDARGEVPSADDLPSQGIRRGLRRLTSYGQTSMICSDEPPHTWTKILKGHEARRTARRAADKV